jgi:hypothetical protein
VLTIDSHKNDQTVATVPSSSREPHGPGQGGSGISSVTVNGTRQWRYRRRIGNG